MASTYAGLNLGWAATNRLRSDLATHLLRLDMPFHKTHTPGELIERVDGDVTTMAEFFGQMVVRVAGNALLVVAILGFLYREDAASRRRRNDLRGPGGRVARAGEPARRPRLDRRARGVGCADGLPRGTILRHRGYPGDRRGSPCREPPRSIGPQHLTEGSRGMDGRCPRLGRHELPVHRGLWARTCDRRGPVPYAAT